MPLVPLPLTGGAFQNVDEFELSNPEKAAALENFVLNDAGSNVDRAGLKQFVSLGTSPVIGLAKFAGVIVAVTNDRKVFKITEAGSSDELSDGGGILLPGIARPSFASDGEFLAIAGGAAPIRWDGTSADTVLLPGSPPTTDSIEFLDGFWILIDRDVTDGQQMRFAGPTAASRLIWNAGDFFSAEAFPDKLVRLSVLVRELHGFGEDSLETFQNFGDPVVPFQRSFVIDRGLASRQSVVQADNTLWYLDDRRRFVFIQGRTPTVISNPFDRVIQNFTTVNDCFGSVLNIEGQYLIQWTFPTEARNFLFDYKRREYLGEWKGFLNGQEQRFRLNAHVKSFNKHFVGDFFDGRIFTLSRDNKDDAGLIRKCVRRTGEIDHGTSTRKRSNFYRFTIKRGVGSLGDARNPVMEVRFKDDGKPFTAPIQVDLGKTGDVRNTVELRRTGIYRRRQLEVSVTDPIEFVLLKVEENIDVLTS